jgi:pyridoxamine 5'-phosphate oxidase
MSPRAPLRAGVAAWVASVVGMSNERPDMPALHSSELAPDPIEQFGKWWELAKAEVPLADAMTLATVDEVGMPDARMVLLKGFDDRGFRFFTNYESAKGEQLEARGSAALIVYWRELDRQVRIRGTAAQLREEESDEYFASRPRESQVGAWASPQSRPLSNRTELDRRVEGVSERFEGSEIERPPFWGGYLVRPERIEFWQGQVGRLHDRFLYLRSDAGAWSFERLGP